MIQENKFELNPFEDEKVSNEWILSVENEKGEFRDQYIYPRLKAWQLEVKPRGILEVGCGQGICSNSFCLENTSYIGIEPSEILLERAKYYYSSKNKNYRLGNVYNLPVTSKSVDGVVLINVLLHLENLDLAIQEIDRVLENGGHFLIITANPSCYEEWERFFYDYSKEGNKLSGKFTLPVCNLSEHVMYLHSLNTIKMSFERYGLSIQDTEVFGAVEGYGDASYFISLKGRKTS